MERIPADERTTPSAQIARFEFTETRRALEALPLDQRAARILVDASGFSYKQAAEICGCPIATAKSRLSRARARLAAILSVENLKDCDPNRPTWPISAANDLVHACN